MDDRRVVTAPFGAIIIIVIIEIIGWAAISAAHVFWSVCRRASRAVRRSSSSSSDNDKVVEIRSHYRLGSSAVASGHPSRSCVTSVHLSSSSYAVVRPDGLKLCALQCDLCACRFCFRQSTILHAAESGIRWRACGRPVAIDPTTRSPFIVRQEVG
ncbi:hypothetical protein TW95_gp1441 [Pandoravirus inopinatum]|uniref:Uncharacterized protein n=1 Tax=Pandoravirus inopinatum TaxID=1605721 RepID=A0A0B5J8F5_9VIRU|nr:hypothetical protein TW95_gp1441 [Pandoravirus inopinatum]AJF98175.1 hypothetical protein [Pandoravirus inopinatum]